MPVKKKKDKPAPPPNPSEKAVTRARKVAAREDYDIHAVHRALEPEHGSDLWEVLIIGRYGGNSKAKIPGDVKDARLPYRIWVREDGTGFVSAGW